MFSFRVLAVARFYSRLVFGVARLLKTSFILRSLDLKLTVRWDISGKDRRAFILAPGPSISSLNNDDWDQVNQNLSIGINSFSRHEFRANTYSLEFGSDGEDFRNSLYEIVRKHSGVKPPRIFLKVTDRHLKLLKSSLEQLTPDAEILLQVPLTSDSKDLEEFKLFFLRWSRLPRAMRLLLLPNQTTSVVRNLIWLSEIGFREIQVLGVDHTNEYFWQNSHSKEQGVMNLSPHSTELAQLPASTLLPFVSSLLLKIHGTRVVFGGLPRTLVD